MNTSLRDIFGESKRPDRERPRVLVFPFDFLSHYLRCLQLADSLRDEVEFIVADSHRYGDHIRRFGFETFAFDDSDADVILDHSVRFDFDWMHEQELERVLTQQIAVIRQLEPDMVLGDVSMTLNMAAEYCQIPCIKLVNGYMSKYYACHRQLPRSHPLTAFMDVLPSWLARRLTSLGETVLLRVKHRTFGRLRRRYKLSARRSFLDELAGDITLICDLPELFPQKALPPNYHIIGPLYHREKTIDPAVQSFVQNGRRTLLVSLGSTGDSEHFQWIRCDSLSSYNIIVTGRDISSLHAPNIYATHFIDHNAILPFCDLLICHGGNGTIYQAIEHAVPILARPNFFEQEYNMQRVQELGLGAVIPENATNARIIELVHQWSNVRNSDVLKNMQSALMAYRSS